MNVRIIHDCAHVAALKLLCTVAHLLREEEQRDAYGEFFEIVKEALAEYAVRYDKLLENGSNASRC